MTDNRFLNVFMDQNNKCNLRCRMCAFSDPRVMTIKKYDMPFWLLERVAEEVFPHAQYVAFSCLTEPLMTKDFSKRLRLLEDFPVPFSEVITNGMLLNDEITRTLIDVSVTRLGISLDGGRKHTYESIRIGASFDRIVENIRRFNRLKAEEHADYPRLRLLHVLSEANINEFHHFLGMAESLGAQAVDVRTVSPFRNAEDQGTGASWFWDTVKKNAETLAAWTEHLDVEDTGYLRLRHGEIVLVDDLREKMTCQRPWDTFAIHANGDVFPCMSWARSPMGNIARQSFGEIWNGEMFESIRAEFIDKMPGVDCNYCKIRKAAQTDEDDDFFFLMLDKKPPEKGDEEE